MKYSELKVQCIKEVDKYYNERLKYLKDVLGSFDAGLQEEMVRSAKLVNKQTAAIEALLKRKNIYRLYLREKN